MYRFLAAAVLSAAAMLAQHPRPTPHVGKGDTAIVQIARTVHDSPLTRHGLFYRAGRETGNLQPGQQVVVTDETVVKTVIGEQKWLRVRPMHKASEGWIYAGHDRNQALVPSKPERNRE